MSPARASDNNGNWHTAERWKAHLDPVAAVRVVQHWDGESAELLIALHARKSAAEIARFHEADPERPVALVLTGTDLYRDLAVDATAHRSLALAQRLVCLQPLAMDALDAPCRAKACVIVQGAEPTPNLWRPGSRAPFVAVGHLRAEKDPQTLFRAVRRLPAGIEVMHIGASLDEALASEAALLGQERPSYRWLGAQPHADTRRRMAEATALVHMSRLEGGANVVIEAITSGTPVLASRIDGNVGLLGDDYPGYFPVGDAAALAQLMQRCMAIDAFRAELASHCATLAPRYTPAAECAAVRRLLEALIGV